MGTPFGVDGPRRPAPGEKEFGPGAFGRAREISVRIASPRTHCRGAVP